MEGFGRDSFSPVGFVDPVGDVEFVVHGVGADGSGDFVVEEDGAHGDFFVLEVGGPFFYIDFFVVGVFGGEAGHLVGFGVGLVLEEDG